MSDRCILCSRPLDLCNASGICAECTLLVANLLEVKIDERWRPAAGGDAVIVSDRGRVARLLTIDHSHRYPGVSIGGRKHYLHTLVAEAFIGPRPHGQLVLHADDDPDNPAPANLRFGSHAENAADARRNRRNPR